MAHDLRTSSLATNKAVESLMEKTPFLQHAARPPEINLFGKNSGRTRKPGESITITKPPRYIGRTGDAMAPENIVDESVTLELDPLFGVDIDVTDRQWKLELAEWKQEVADPAMENIGARQESFYQERAILECFNAVGTPGTAINNDLSYLRGKDILTERGAPKSDRMLCAASRQISTLVNANKALFHDPEKIKAQYRSGDMRGMAHGFAWYESTSLPSFTTGAYGTSTPAIQGGSQSGSTLAIDGLESGLTTWNEGDVFYIDGVYAVHPQNRISTGQLMPFVVTTTTSDSSGAFAALPISPAIKGPGDPHQNVSALPANNALVYTQGSTTADPDQYPSTLSPQAFAFHKNAVQMVYVALPEHNDSQYCRTSVHKATRVTVRVWQKSDIRSGGVLTRFDVLSGMAIARPELMVRFYN